MRTKEHHNCGKIIKTTQGGDREQIAALEDTPVGASNVTMNTHPALIDNTGVNDFLKLFYDDIVTTESRQYTGMTEACLVDRLKQDLATNTGCITVTGSEKIYDNRKYYNQARNLLKIGAFRPVPPFLVCVSDVSPELLKELRVLDKSDRSFVLKQAVGRIFEDINSKLYHESISRVLEVRLVP